MRIVKSAYRVTLQLIILFLAFTSGSSAQVDSAFLDIGEIRTIMKSNGTLFWDGHSTPIYEVYADTVPSYPVSSIFCGELWIGGIDGGGALKLAAQTYRQTGNDYWSGPIDKNGNSSLKVASDWSKVWNLNRDTLAAFMKDVSDGRVDDPIPNDILYWPGTKNPRLSGLATQEVHAPFYDHNGDQRYDPFQGDYPIMKGDQMLWCVINDVADIHSETNGDQMGVQIEISMYMFKPTLDTVLNKSLFITYEIYNKGSNKLDSVYVGQFIDYDVGCFNNDYVGCIPSCNTTFGYNGTKTDDACGSSPGYGNNPPLQSFTFLNAKLSNHIVYNNDGTAAQGNPRTASDHYRYMTGSWRDGTIREFGGDSYQEGTYPYPFMFPIDSGNFSDTTQWTECALGNTAADRRNVSSTGPYSLNPGDHLSIETVYITHFQPYQYGCDGGIEGVIKNIKHIKAMNDSLKSIKTGSAEVVSSSAKDLIEIYPNPANGKLSIDFAGLSLERIYIYSITGQLMKSVVIETKKNLDVDISSLSSGIYIVQGTSESLNLAQKLVVAR